MWSMCLMWSIGLMWSMWFNVVNVSAINTLATFIKLTTFLLVYDAT